MNWLRTAYRAYQAFQDDDGAAMAGYIAFSSLLGFFPFVILATNIAAVALGEAQGQLAVDTLFDYAPEHVARTLEPVLVDVLAGASGGVLTFSALAALWFSSNAVEAVRVSFDRAYGQHSAHHWLKGRLISLVCIVIGLIVALTLGTLIVLAPLLFQFVEATFGIAIPSIALLVRYGLGLSVFVMFLMFLHMALPRHRIPMRKLWAGVLSSTLIWITAATAFSIYLGLTPTYSFTYGALAGVVITLMFFYLTGMAIIFGAEINAVRASERANEWQGQGKSNGSS